MFEPIAVIGYGCVYPQKVNTTDKFWEMVLTGECQISEVPLHRWNWNLYYSPDKHAENKTYCKMGACIVDYEEDLLDKKKFLKYKIQLNRIQQIIMDTILQALDKTNYSEEDLKEKIVSFMLGNMLGDDIYSDYSLRFQGEEVYESIRKIMETDQENKEAYELMINKLKKSIAADFPTADPKNSQMYINSSLAYSIKEIMELKGASGIIDGACSSGILVIDEAIKQLHESKTDMCIVSGALGSMNVIGSVGFSKIGGLASEINRPLDKESTGLNSSEGVGTIIIKRLADAVRDQDNIYGIISGIGSANDGKGKSIYAPRSDGQLKAMRKAVERAGITPRDIDYVEVHATGTPTGDLVEMRTLLELFQPEGMDPHSVAIGSVKYQIGHSFSAAGMANLIKVLESIKHKTIPPTWGYKSSPEELDLDKSPVYVNVATKEWKEASDHPRRAVVNAFGFGGINSSLILEEYNESYHSRLLGQKVAVDYHNLDIAIVGIGVIDSQSTGYKEWFKNSLDEMAAKDHYPEDRWNQRIASIYNNYLKNGYFVENYEFPWLKFKIPPKILTQLDRAQPMAMLAADEAISDLGADKIEGSDTSVYIAKAISAESSSIFNIGVRHLEYVSRLEQIAEFNNFDLQKQKAIREQIENDLREYIPSVQEDCLPGYMDNIVSGRISNFYDLHGTSMIVDSGSSSFTLALKQGIDEIMTDQAEYTIVGGIHANMSPDFLTSYGYYTDQLTDQGILTDSVIPAEGAVFFILKRFDRVKEGEKVYARIGEIVNRRIENKISEDDIQMKNIFAADKKLPYYFGAHMGFQMLEGLKKLEKGSSIYIEDLAILGDQYAVRMMNKGYKENKTKTPKRQEKEYNILYVYGSDKNELVIKLKSINEKNYKKFIYENRKYPSNRWKMTIPFKNWSDIESKIELIDSMSVESGDGKNGD